MHKTLQLSDPGEGNRAVRIVEPRVSSLVRTTTIVELIIKEIDVVFSESLPPFWERTVGGGLLGLKERILIVLLKIVIVLDFILSTEQLICHRLLF